VNTTLTWDLLLLPNINLHRNKVLKNIYIILGIIKNKVTLKIYGQLGSTFSIQKDIERIEIFILNNNVNKSNI